MGSALSRCLPPPARTTTLPPPSSGTVMTSQDVGETLSLALSLDLTNCFISDRSYFAYSMADLHAFLAQDASDRHTYVSDQFDCDDFARVLVGREREWFGRRVSDDGGKYGSTFGTVWGDIRREETDEEPNYHAMCIFIDNDHNVVLVEPQTDEVWPEITSVSTFYMVNV